VNGLLYPEERAPDSTTTRNPVYLAPFRGGHFRSTFTPTSTCGDVTLLMSLNASIKMSEAPSVAMPMGEL
jgi:hypothetical protein